MSVRKWAVPLVMFVSSVAISAGPKAVFKSTTFDCGKVLEGKVEMLHAEFIVNNTGDQPLKITNVRPGCGCTNVKFDSTVAPGKSMTLKSDVNIKGYQSGPISKYITFTSNSTVDSVVKLIIQAQIFSPVSVSERYISLDTTARTKAHVVDVLSMKKELKISGVSFKVNNTTNNNTAWQSDLPVDVKFKLSPVDTVRTDSLSIYKLELFTPVLKGTFYGDFTIKTDNPDKKEIVVQGLIQG